MMGEKENARKFTLDVGWATLSLLAMMAVGFILSIVLGNFFDAAGLGAYSMVLTVWTIASLTAGIGIPMAVIKFVAEYVDRPKICNSIISSSMLLGTVSGLAVTAVLFLTSDIIEGYMNIPNLGHLLRIVSFSFPFIVNNEIFLGALNAYREMKVFAALEIFRRGGILFITLILVWLGMGVAGAVIALVIAPALTTLMILFIHGKYFKFGLFNTRRTLGKITKFGGQLYAASSIGIINSHAATLLIGFYLTDSDVGIYAVALMFFNAMMLIPHAIQKITYPAFATHIAKKRNALIKKMMRFTMQFSLIMMSVACLILVFYYDDIIGLIFPGKEAFLMAVEPLILLAIVGVPFGVIVPVGAILISAGRADLSLKITIVQAIVNIGMAMFLIPLSLNLFGFQLGGLNGAAIALGANFIVGLVFTFALLTPVLKIRMNFTKLHIGLGIFFMFLLAGLALAHFTGLDGNLVGAIILPLFVLCLYLAKVLSRDLVLMVLQLVRKDKKSAPRPSRECP